jgi:glycoprotein endo-alpha-1,2-mannosidase
MRRVLFLLAVTALLQPAAARAGNPLVSIFYYPWYGSSAYDGGFTHWGQRGHSPPNDIASAFYPARGLYSSSDPWIVAAQMAEIRAAGVGELSVSWWGRGSVEDDRLPLVANAARAHGLTVAIHLEPYAGRTVETTEADVAYLRSLGFRTFYLYRPEDYPAEAWLPLNRTFADIAVLAQTGRVGYALKGGFAGVYTYDVLVYDGDGFGRMCASAHAHGLLCAPSVGPGYDARRGSGDPRVRPRRAGATYDGMWRSAIAAGADRVTITSYNEWHEGTQIEPAAPGGRRGPYRYLSYDGAWGLKGAAAARAYLDRTAVWAQRFAQSALARVLFGPR